MKKLSAANNNARITATINKLAEVITPDATTDCALTRRYSFVFLSVHAFCACQAS